MSTDPRRAVIVLASTFPASPTDPVPAFVRDQVVALATRHPELDFHVLAPHDRRSATVDRTEHAEYTEHRFHYIRPRRAEQLAGRGIMPALRQNKLLYLVVPFLFIGELRALRRLVTEVRPVIIYAHWFTPQAVVADRVARRMGVPFSYTTHASDVEVWRRIPAVGGRIVRSVSKRAVGISAVSRRSREKLERFFDGHSAELPLAIIPMGVPAGRNAPDESKRAEARLRLNVGSKTVIAFIGRLVEKKGTEFLLRAVAASENLGDWELAIAGEGPLRASLGELAAELGIRDRVRFTGYLSGTQKDDLFRAADVFAVPSVVAADGDAEGLPVALLEGLSYGLPCVATRASGADDVIIDGVDGFLCNDGDVEALATALCRAVALSPEDRRALAAEARATSARFDWPEIAETTYRHLLAPAFEPEVRP